MNGVIAAIVIVMSAMQSSRVELIAADSMSNVDVARTAVASNEAEWTALWTSHAPDKPRPKVDFATRRVVAVFLGSRPSAGYHVEIVGSKTEGNTVVVEWAEARPKPGMLLAQVLTSPAAIATIPKTAADVTFRKVTR